MKIKKIAAATLIPAAVAGVTVSSWAAVDAATSHQARHDAAHQVRDIRPLHRAHSLAQQHAKNTTPAHARASEAHAVSSVALEARRDAHAKPAHPSRAEPKASPASPSSLLSGMSPFERCVAWRESGDNPTASSAGLFGILPSTWASLGYSGTAGQASVAMQKAAFNRLYAQYGTSPWAPYDGC